MSWFMFEYWAILIFIVGVLIAFGFCLGVYYQNTRAIEKVREIREECSRQISRAFTEGHKQGVREATPKHDARGRFTR